MRPHILDEIVGDMRRVITKSEVHTWYVLIGPHGAVQFAYMEMPASVNLSFMGEKFMGTDVGYHAYTPQYENHYPMECEWMVGATQCYYDGSSLAADDWVRAWRRQGGDPEWIWENLSNYYRYTFEQEVSHGMERP